MLGDRIRRAVASPPPRAASRKRDRSALVVHLPLDVVHDYLASHPLVVHQLCTPQVVHRALLDLLQRERAPATEETGETRGAPPKEVRRTVCCPIHCDAPVQSDPREGNDVCSVCGLVLARHLRVQPTFEEETFHGRTRVPGVSQQVVQMATGVKLEPSYMEDLHHWNQFTHHTQDRLLEMDLLLREWTDGAHSRAARLAAVLLLSHVRPYANRPLTQCEAVEVLVDPRPKPTFACATCGEKQHSAKEARFHCRGPKVYR